MVTTICAPEVALPALLLVACSAVESTDLAAQAFCRGGFAIVDVQVDPATFHTNDPRSVLASAEGCGPRSLDIAVSSSVSATNSYSGSYTPTNAQFTTALTYDVGASFSLAASSTVLVPLDAYARVEAFPAYQRSTYRVVGTACPGQVVVGTGVALKPVGVYFETCGAIGTDTCGLWCVNGRPRPPPPTGASPEGSEDAGAAEAAGTVDGG